MIYHHYLPGYMDFPLDEDRPFTTIEELSEFPPVKLWLDRNPSAVLCFGVDRDYKDGDRRPLMVFLTPTKKFYVIGYISGRRYDILSMRLPRLKFQERELIEPECPDCAEKLVLPCAKCMGIV